MTDYDHINYYTTRFIALTVILMVLGIICGVAFGEEIPDNLAIRAIIGESSSQGYRGMLAVSRGIRNRGTLQGVYGVKAKHIDKEPQWVWKLARKAWKESENKDITGGATHWENIKAFGIPYWADSMVKTVLIGDHQFYK